ncbi:hypothetical protein PR202_ga28595 [Eleusine coracana subsp. coracana]|uniref:Uncharacterized protein n=1 Tax=Eleusine coracana subsp. coracana TaxID=191504 RepID=A0AAV5DK56_ELECO|nr:hypothetical protein PR202_ga28595 [Eleusine coracana subsp. coracana]
MGSSVLREIRFEQDASPQMESIQVAHCTLKLGINGIKHLRKLKEISLSYDCKVVRLRMLLQEVNAHPNQPVLRLWKDRSQHDLGDPEGTYEDFDAAESLREHDGEGMESTTPTASATVKQAQRRQSKMLDRPACNLLQLIPDVRLLVATGPASYLALAVSIHS